MWWRRLTFRLALLFLWPGCGLPLWVHAAQVPILIVSAERNAAFADSVESFISELERGGVSRGNVQYLTLAEARISATRAGQLVLALGVDAAAEMARSETRVPVLCAFVPSQSFELIVRTTPRKAPNQFSAIYLNQAFGRQLDLIQLALPQRRSIGVLLGSHSRAQVPLLEGATRARSLGLTQTYIDENESLFTKLQMVLEASQVLLALPDPQVFNSGSVQNILLSALRAGVPVVSFSPAYVRAGALMAIYSTPAQVGLQAAQLARSVLQGKELAAPQYPRDFQIGVNASLASSMNLNIDAETLTEQLKRLELTK